MGDGTVKHVVGFSGGIDSQAVARWVLNRFPSDDVILLNSDVGGHEHQMTVEFIATYSRDVHPVTVVSPIVADLGSRGTKPGKTKERRDKYGDDHPLTMDVLAEIKGLFPSRKMQFCTEHLKLAPAHRWMKENLQGKGVEWIRYTGVRRDESQKRKGSVIEGWDDYFGCPIFHPIADWTKQMCFDFCHAHDEETNPLYSLGFNRVGCSPCVNANKQDIFNWVQRYPDRIDRVREWEKRLGIPFFKIRIPHRDTSFVDDVVAWSKTVRGGKQTSLEVLLSPPACESQYGLCE